MIKRVRGLGIERRRFKRFRSYFLLKCLDMGTGRVTVGRLYDFGAQGFSLIVGSKIKRSTFLKLWVDIPDHKGFLRAKGPVAWTEELPLGTFRIGIDFGMPDFVGVSSLIRI